MPMLPETSNADSPGSAAMAQDRISEVDNHDEIAALPYRFWIERGSPIAVRTKTGSAPRRSSGAVRHIQQQLDGRLSHSEERRRRGRLPVRAAR
jgi:hypothetical protein